MWAKQLSLCSCSLLGFPAQSQILPCADKRWSNKKTPQYAGGILFPHVYLSCSVAAEALAPIQQKRGRSGRQLLNTQVQPQDKENKIVLFSPLTINKHWWGREQVILIPNKNEV